MGGPENREHLNELLFYMGHHKDIEIRPLALIEQYYDLLCLTSGHLLHLSISSRVRTTRRAAPCTFIVSVERNKDQTNYFVHMFYLFLILC